MKIYYSRKSKDPIYYVQEGFRNPATGKATTRNVKRIGRHSELLSQGIDDPLSYAKKIAQEMTDMKNSGRETVSFEIDYNEKLPFSSPDDEYSKPLDGLNIGYFYLQAIYYQLDLMKFFEKITKGRKITFDCNLINRFLTFDRILDPKSKKAFQENLSVFYERPDFDYQHILRFMDILIDHKEEYLAHLFTCSNNVIPRSTSVIYYDCTNYYCETETADETIDEATGELITGLRQFGVSKEHRPNPIVEMGLIMDARGIPISMCVHKGNTNEQLTAVPLEKEIEKFIPRSKFIYVSDGGLGSYNIRQFNSLGGKAFIVTQSIKKLSKPLQEAVFNDFGYKLLSSDHDVTIEKMKTFDRFDPDNRALYEDRAYKVVNGDKEKMWDGTYSETVTRSGKTRRRKNYCTLRQDIIITYSRKMAEYQKSVRNRQIDRARRLLQDAKNPEDIKKGPNDVRRFLKSTSKEKFEYVLDEEKIRREEMFDGFYAVATNLDDPAREILKISAKRYKIEDCFRIMKTNFGARPINHYKDSRIEAHFLICYTALLVYRLLECKLEDCGLHVTTDNLIRTLQAMLVSNVNNIYYQSLYTNSRALDALEKCFGFNLQVKYHRPKNFTQILRKNRRRHAYTTNKSA